MANLPEESADGQDHTTSLSADETAHPPASADATEAKAVFLRQILRAQAYSLPLPPPEVLEQYSRLVPDAPERFFHAWEEESEHRRVIELRKLDDRRRTQWLAFTLALAGLMAAGYFLHQGELVTGSLVFLGEVIALAGLYLGSRPKTSASPRRDPEDDSPS